MYLFSKRSLFRLEGVDEQLLLVTNRALLISPIDFGISWLGGVRTAEEQNGLFKKGVSKCDGYNVKSKHQKGLAIDFFAWVDYVSLEKKHLSIVACAHLQAGIDLGIQVESGGLWESFQDWPHINLR